MIHYLTEISGHSRAACSAARFLGKGVQRKCDFDVDGLSWEGYYHALAMCMVQNTRGGNFAIGLNMACEGQDQG